MEQPHDEHLDEANGYGAEHEDIRPATADNQVGVEGDNGDESATDAKYLQKRHTRKPFVGNGYGYQFGHNQSQSPHSGKSDEGGEAKHLPEDSL